MYAFLLMHSAKFYSLDFQPSVILKQAAVAGCQCMARAEVTSESFWDKTANSIQVGLLIYKIQIPIIMKLNNSF